ncbi:MAG TPA: CopG family transcriptional regulator [Nocardioidaceae bacterium]|nr:CopG family transcriptional regulator [Nocardioidaceae bacterium]
MRTTITLDPDVAALVDKAMRERGISFKHAVNDALRRALTRGAARRYSPPTADMGTPRRNLDKALQLSGDVEDDELLRKARMNK